MDQGLLGTNPNCPELDKGLIDTTRNRKLNEAKRAKLEEEGQDSENLGCLRCKSCCTF